MNNTKIHFISSSQMDVFPKESYGSTHPPKVILSNPLNLEIKPEDINCNGCLS